MMPGLIPCYYRIAYVIMGELFRSRARASPSAFQQRRPGGTAVPTNIRHALHKKYGVDLGPIYYLAFFSLCLSAIIFFTIPMSFADQTRDQCEKCCRSSEQDEYYYEQCRLKCFRNPNHCADQKSQPEAREETAQPSPPPRARVRPPAVAPGSTPPRVMGSPPSAPGAVGPPPGGPVMTGPPAAAQRPPAQQPTGAQPGMTPRQASQRGMLVFPSPLNLAPGRESEAAGQILSLNGISPQHPNYRAGVQAIAAILQNFARNNPSGGSLPTDDMQQVIIQLK